MTGVENLFPYNSIVRSGQLEFMYRRLGIAAERVQANPGFYQMNMFIDYEQLAREKRLQSALGKIRYRYGSNAIFKGNNLLEGATQLERNAQIGGHRA